LHLKIIAELALLFRRAELIERLRSARDARQALEALFPVMVKH